MGTVWTTKHEVHEGEIDVIQRDGYIAGKQIS